MAEKNIGQFSTTGYDEALFVVVTKDSGPSANVDPFLMAKEELKGDPGDEGPAGDPAPQVQIQGSVDSIVWDVFDDTSIFARFSVDGGSIWYESRVRGVDGIDGTDGTDGTDGIDGKSAYQVALDGGFVGNEAAWLASLKGADGADGAKGERGDDGEPGPTIVPNEYGIFDEAKVTSIETADVDFNMLIVAGGDERSNTSSPAALTGDMSGHLVRYEAGGTWLDLGPVVGIQGPKGSKGDQGDPGVDGTDGIDGPSAYEIAVTNGFIGTESEWLESLKVKGDKGDKGDQGLKGDRGDVPLTTLAASSSTSYTLALGDAEKYLRFSSTSAKTVTVPNNSAVAFPYAALGETTTISLFNGASSGNMTIVAASGVTFRYKAGFTLAIPPYGGVVLTKVGTNEWDIVGDLEPNT